MQEELIKKVKALQAELDAVKIGACWKAARKLESAAVILKNEWREAEKTEAKEKNPKP